MKITSPHPDVWEVRYQKNKVWRVLVVRLKNRSVDVEDGPEDPSARCHEGTGGTQSYESFLQSPAPWVDDFPDMLPLVRRAVKQKLAEQAR